MIRLLSISVLVLGLCSSSFVYARGLRIGVVNMQRAVGETADGKRAEARLKRMKKQLEGSLSKKMADFYAEEKQLRKSWSILKDAEKRKRAQASAKKFEGLRKEYMMAERKLLRQKTVELQKISVKLNRIILKLAKRDKYDYIFSNAAVLYAPRHTDMTNEVIRLYNGK